MTLHASHRLKPFAWSKRIANAPTGHGVSLRHQHLVSRLDERSDVIEDDLLCASAGQHLGGFVSRTEIRGEAITDRPLQIGRSRCRRIFCVPSRYRFCTRASNVLRGWEV